MAILKAYEQKEVTLKEKTYVITKYPATRGVKYFNLLRKVFAPAFIKASQSEGGLTFIELFESVSNNLDAIDEEVVKEMVCTAVEMMPQAFDFEFSGNYFSLFELLKEILKFNYQDVFIELGLGDMLE